MEYQTIVFIISIIFLVIGILGTFLPVLPGLGLSFVGMLVYKFGTEAPLPMYYIYIFGGFLVLSLILDYVVPARLSKKYGGTRWGSIGAVLGSIAGLLFIPLPFGFLVGMFLGVIVGELLNDNSNIDKAIQSAKGAFIGFLYSSALNLSLGVAMLAVVLWDYFKHL